MCQSVKCNTCSKTSWTGCGQHLTGIFKSIPEDKRCFCGYSPEELEEEKKNPKNKQLGALPKQSGQQCLIF